MGLFSRLRSSNKMENANIGTRYEMVIDKGNGFYSWDGKLYKSDLIRSCIRPRAKAVGMAVAKHVRVSINEDGQKDIKINPDVWMRFLL